MKLEVLHVRDCPNLAPLLDRIRRVTDVAVTTREIATDHEAAVRGMTGSPTLLVDGTDPFATAGLAAGLSCRIYRDEKGQITPTPSVAQLRDVVAIHSTGAAAALSRWRTCAVQLAPVQQAVHQAILRTFAATGGPPSPSELDPITRGTSTTTVAALAALHDADAIRLGPDGGIAVAYPFSTMPTRHRVRIAGRTHVHAMCAIDALGISAMLGEDTRIESADITTGTPVTVTTTGGRTTWDPTTAVVFVGADACGGPSADCCCDYLNFFSDQSAAEVWARVRSHIPGEILPQAAAEELAIRLFGPLLDQTSFVHHPGLSDGRDPDGRD